MKNAFYFLVVFFSITLCAMDLNVAKKSDIPDEFTVSQCLSLIKRHQTLPRDIKHYLLDLYHSKTIQETCIVKNDKLFPGLHKIVFYNSVITPFPHKKRRFYLSGSEYTGKKAGVTYFDRRTKKEYEAWNDFPEHQHVRILGPNQLGYAIIKHSFVDLRNMPGVVDIPLTHFELADRIICLHPRKKKFISRRRIQNGPPYFYINYLLSNGTNSWKELKISRESLQKRARLLDVDQPKFGPADTVFMIESSCISKTEYRAAYYQHKLVQYDPRDNKKITSIGGVFTVNEINFIGNFEKKLTNDWEFFQANAEKYFNPEQQQEDQEEQSNEMQENENNDQEQNQQEEIQSVNVEKQKLTEELALISLLRPESYSLAIEGYKYSPQYHDLLLLKCRTIFNMKQDLSQQYISQVPYYLLYNLKTKAFRYIGLCEKFGSKMPQWGQLFSYKAKTIQRDNAGERQERTCLRAVFHSDALAVNELLLVSAARQWLRQKEKNFFHGTKILEILKNRTMIANKYHLIWRTGRLFKQVYRSVKKDEDEMFACFRQLFTQ